jgi:Thiamine monophosphate synthase
MLVLKKKYYLFVENTREFNLDLIKIRNKFNIIYRNHDSDEKIQDLLNFRKNCKKNGVNFYISNNTKLLFKLRADGLYISSHNKNLLLKSYSKKGFSVIGSAHNQKEIDIKIKQGCDAIVFSRLFETKYTYKKGFLGVQKFNIFSRKSKIELVPWEG